MKREQEKVVVISKKRLLQAGFPQNGFKPFEGEFTEAKVEKMIQDYGRKRRRHGPFGAEEFSLNQIQLATYGIIFPDEQTILVSDSIHRDPKLKGQMTLMSCGGHLNHRGYVGRNRGPETSRHGVIRETGEEIKIQRANGEIIVFDTRGERQVEDLFEIEGAGVIYNPIKPIDKIHAGIVYWMRPKEYGLTILPIAQGGDEVTFDSLQTTELRKISNQLTTWAKTLVDDVFARGKHLDGKV